MPIQSSLSRVGVAVQSGKGTAAADPTYAQGVSGGAVVSVDVEQALADVTSGSRMAAHVDRTGVMASQEFTGRAHAAPLGAYLYGALGGVVSTGDSPYTHEFTVADDLPFLTTFGEYDGNYYSVEDVRITEFGLSFEAANPVEVNVAGAGTVVGYPADFSPSVDATLESYFTAASGTFLLSVDSDTPAGAPIASGEITISTNAEPFMLSGSITPEEVFPGRTEIEVTFDVIPDDLDYWRTIVTGSAAGSSASAVPVYGSFEVEFTNGADTLTLSASRVAFTCDFPEADPSGGPATISLAGLVVADDGGDGFVATLVNEVESYD